MNYQILNEGIITFRDTGDDSQLSYAALDRMYDDFISCLESIEAAETIYDLWNRHPFLIRRTEKNQNNFLMIINSNFSLEIAADFDREPHAGACISIIDIKRHGLEWGYTLEDKLRPFVRLGPGHAIKRDMIFNGWNQKEFASIIGLPLSQVANLINNKEPVTMGTAKLLAKVFGPSPQFWINLDTNYRLSSLEDTAEESMAAAKSLIYRYMPMREMLAKGWLPSKNTDLVDAVKKFWGIRKINFYFIDQKLEAYAEELDNTLGCYNLHHVFSWLRQAQLMARTISVPSYRRGELEKLAREIPGYSLDDNGVGNFLARLNACGVKFSRIPHISDVGVDGASLLDGGNPALVYTARHDRIDNFWFTMLHGIAHVLMHLSEDKREALVNLDGIAFRKLNPIEEEAKNFSREIFRSAEIFARLRHIPVPITPAVQNTAEKFGVSPAIVVGCLQHHGIRPNLPMLDMLAPITPQLPEVLAVKFPARPDRKQNTGNY